MIASTTLLHFGGNGHCEARIEAAREALMSRGIRLVDAPYPGFEGRPGVDTPDQFLASLDVFCMTGGESRLTTPSNPSKSICGFSSGLTYDVIRDFLARETPHPPAVATGIGGLIALGLRSRGVLPGRLILQAPVLWGLEHRTFPKLMRWRAVRGLIRLAFRNPAFQRRFARKQFRNPPDPAFLARFFEGYERCSAFGDLFAWFTPSFLRSLEARFAGHTLLLRDIEVWWGGKDAVLGLDELRATERALGVRWPVREFPDWGHYPMIDDPEEWAEALADALERPERVPQPEDPQAR